MYNNIGAKIKVLAKVCAILLASGSFAYGLYLVIDGWTEWVGFLLMVLGPILSWILMFFMYGYGELIEKTADTNKTVNDIIWQMEKNGEKASKSDRQKCGIPIYLQVQKPAFSQTSQTSELICPVCGAHVERNQKFCSNCGQPFSWK